MYRQIAVGIAQVRASSNRVEVFLPLLLRYPRGAEVKSQMRSVFQGGLISVFSSAACGRALGWSSIRER